MFFRVNTRFLKDTYLFLSVYHRLDWVFWISHVLVQFSLSFFWKGRGFTVNKFYFLVFLLNVSVVFDRDILMLRYK